MNKPCILFIPVSSLSGIGEYMRSLIIANAIQAKYPAADIHFLLNHEVSYQKNCPYKVHLSNGSATKDTKSVNRIIQKLRPDLVIFDASGRAQQFKQAKKSGALVAFISQHKAKRRRGLKLNRLFHTDIHWVVQPNFCIEPLTLFEKMKLTLFKKPHPKNIGAVFNEPILTNTDRLFSDLSLVKEQYILFNAGSGGHKNNGQLSTDLYYEAALKVQKKLKIKCVVIFGDNYPRAIPSSTNDEKGLLCIQSVSNENFVMLLNHAKGCIVSAGDTLLQCIELQKLTVATAVSKDQPQRLRACVKEGLVLPAKLTVDDIYNQTCQLLSNNDKKQQQLSNMEKYESLSALHTLITDIDLLLGSAHASSDKI
jgi:spore coat polysaccharide biosynthesis predicted glycosyltransferase SpsG